MTDAPLPLHPKEPWYAQGLRFSCTGCGECCTGSPGYTWVSLEEIAAIADYLKLSISEFSKRYLKRVGNRFSLVERGPHFDCVFLKEKRCQIYPVRPTQCRTFPFWPEHLHSQEGWEEAAARCEGISKEARCFSLTEIESLKEGNSSV